VLAIVAVALMAAARTAAAADREIRPFVGATFEGATTFVDNDQAVGKPHGIYGVSAVLIGDVFGVEGEVGWAPGFFEAGSKHLVLSSGLFTATGNVMVAMPKRLTEYTLRPYLVAGAGVMHVWQDDYFGVLTVRKNLAVMNVGGGVSGFLTNHVGLAWEVRRFSNLKDEPPEPGVSIGPVELSFWRATMAVVFRY